MQCHIEMTADMVATWCETGRQEIEESAPVSPAVQRAPQMLQDLETRLHALHQVAERVYDRWLEGVSRGSS
jgi:hypothetical protein